MYIAEVGKQLLFVRPHQKFTNQSPSWLLSCQERLLCSGSPASKRKVRLKFTRRCALLQIVTALSGIVVYNLYKVRQLYCKLLPENPARIGQPEEDYVYVVDPDETNYVLKKNFLPWWPQVYKASYAYAWRVVEDTKSEDPEIRSGAVKILSEMDFLGVAEYHQLAQALDYRTAIALAHSGASPNFIMAPVVLHSEADKMCFGTKFREILAALPAHQVHDCLNIYIKTALKFFDPTDEEFDDLNLETLSGFESELIVTRNPAKKMCEARFLYICIQAILSHSRIPEQLSVMIEKDILNVLIMVYKKYKANTDLIYLVVKLLANLSSEPSAAPLMLTTGCLKLLMELSQEKDLRLSMPAKKALHNLDRDFKSESLSPGIYQLYPERRYDENILKYDIIFVHGLLGGAFRTWRRQDLNTNLESDADTEEQDKIKKTKTFWRDRLSLIKQNIPTSYHSKLLKNTVLNNSVIPPSREYSSGEFKLQTEVVNQEEEYIASEDTQCWPKDWLPLDCPDARVIAVDFDSFVTHWWTVCPVESQQRTLVDRSNELLQKLVAAGVGKRPIMWVSHSMGGLLVKHVICQSDQSQVESVHSVSKNTKGVVYCSVPHFGSNMAALSATGKFLLMPTLEIEELSNETRDLTMLQDLFRVISDKYAFHILSFGEGKETLSAMGLQLQLVPFSSSDPGHGEYFPMQLDHLNICKPYSRLDNF